MINYITKYGLYVFAYDPSAQPANNTTATELSAGMAEFYSKRLLSRALPSLVFAQFASKETIPANQGKTINWRKFLSFGKASQLVEGVVPDPTKVYEEKVEASVIQVGGFSPYTDLVSMTHLDLRIAELVDLHSEQAALTIDSLVRDELCTSTNIIYAPIVSGDATTEVTSRANITKDAKLTPEVIAKVTTFLRKQNAPTIDGTHYALVVHPSVSFDLLTNPNWISIHSYKNPENIYNGEIGTLYGCRFFESTNVKVTKDGASKAAVYDCIALGKEAFKMCDVAGQGIEVIVKPITAGGAADNPLNQKGSVGFKLAAFACKITQPGRICRVVCGSSFSGIDEAN